MNGLDPIRLQAFLLAIAQLDVGLSPELHRSIQDIGVALENHQPNIDDQIEAILQQHYRLQDLYREAYQTLLQNQSEERRHATGQPDYLPVLIHGMAVPILISENFNQAAKAIVQQSKQSPNLSAAVRWYALSLQRALDSRQAKQQSVLQALEKRPLTVKGISHIVGLTSDQTWTIVQSLWQNGYIDRASSNIFYKIFPMLQDRRQTCQSLDAETYLTLTSRGHFHLHPVLSLGTPQNRR